MIHNPSKLKRNIIVQGYAQKKNPQILQDLKLGQMELGSKLLKVLENGKGVFNAKVLEYERKNAMVEPWVPVANRTFLTAPLLDRENFKNFFKSLSYEGDGRLGDPKQDDRLNTIISLWGKKCIEAQDKGSTEYKIFVGRGFDLSHLTGNVEDMGKNIVLNRKNKQIYIRDFNRPQAPKELFSAMVDLVTKDLNPQKFEDYKREYLMDAQRIDEYYDRVKRINMNAFIIADPARAKEYKKVGNDREAKIIFPNTGFDQIDCAAPYSEEVVGTLEKLKKSFSKEALQKVLQKNDEGSFQDFYRSKVKETAEMIFEKIQKPKQKFEQYMLLSNNICHLNEHIIQSGVKELSSFYEHERLKFSPSLERAIKREINKEKESQKDHSSNISLSI